MLLCCWREGGEAWGGRRGREATTWGTLAGSAPWHPTRHPRTPLRAVVVYDCDLNASVCPQVPMYNVCTCWQDIWSQTPSVPAAPPGPTNIVYFELGRKRKQPGKLKNNSEPWVIPMLLANSKTVLNCMVNSSEANSTQVVRLPILFRNRRPTIPRLLFCQRSVSVHSTRGHHDPEIAQDPHRVLVLASQTPPCPFLSMSNMASPSSPFWHCLSLSRRQHSFDLCERRSSETSSPVCAHECFHNLSEATAPQPQTSGVHWIGCSSMTGVSTSTLMICC